MPLPVAVGVMLALMVEFYVNGFASRFEVMVAIDKAAQDVADRFATPETWGRSAEHVAANEAAMARAGGPAPRRKP